MVTMCDASLASDAGNGEFKILYVFMSPIILSICTRLLEIFLSAKTCRPDILFFFLKKDGIFTCMSRAAKISWTLNPLSAITESFASHICGKALRSTICLSEVAPPYAGDRYEIKPPGVDPTRTIRRCYK